MSEQNGTPFDNEAYINIESFRKNGTGVKTPVWLAPLDGKLVVFCAGDSFKVKRIRNNPKVKVAACDMRGKPRGEWLDGTGVVIEDRAHIDRIEAALKKKYGLQMSIGNFFAGLTGRKNKRAYLELSIGNGGNAGGAAGA